MWNDGGYILWQPIVQMYYQDSQNGLTLMPRITFNHIKLNAYSTIRVSLAAQVLSTTGAAVLSSFGPPNAQSTSKLCQIMVHFLIASMCAASQKEKNERKFGYHVFL